jgi:hypothetical protein
MWANQGMSMCATCLLSYDARVWSPKAVVDDEGKGHMNSCR